MTNQKSHRSHDAFFRWLFADENHSRALLKLCAKQNPESAEFLNFFDLNSLERIPDSYSEVDETGEADLAFRVKNAKGLPGLIGMLLAHKSGSYKSVFAQISRYADMVMEVQNDMGMELYTKDNPYGLLPTWAFVFYNGKGSWDPMKILRERYSDYFLSSALPCQCSFIDMKMISDEDCTGCDDVATAMGLTAMKYAFDREKLLKALLQFKSRFQKLPPAEAKDLLKKISLYLKEFLDDKVIEELNGAFV